jgi:steroid delta-isomerase-like uncharacterized protein
MTVTPTTSHATPASSTDLASGAAGGNDRAYVANIFTLKPGADLDTLLQRMRHGIETTSSKNPGYLGDTILQSVDGTQVINFSAWSGGLAQLAANNHADAQDPVYVEQMASVTELADMAPMVYTVAYRNGAAPINEADEADEVTEADLHRWIDAWNSHDIDRILDLFTDDAVMNQPQNPAPLSKAQLGAFFAMMFGSYEDIHFELQAHTIRGRDVASWERVTATMSGPFTDPATGRQTPPTNRRFDILGAMHLTYADRVGDGPHKIKEVRIYWDRLQLNQQLGLVAAPATAGGDR